MLNIIYAHCKTENNRFDGYVRPPLFRQSKYCKCLAVIYNLVACPYPKIIIYNPHMIYAILICELYNQINFILLRNIVVWK